MKFQIYKGIDGNLIFDESSKRLTWENESADSRALDTTAIKSLCESYDKNTLVLPENIEFIRLNSKSRRNIRDNKLYENSKLIGELSIDYSTKDLFNNKEDIIVLIYKTIKVDYVILGFPFDRKKADKLLRDSKYTNQASFQFDTNNSSSFTKVNDEKGRTKETEIQIMSKIQNSISLENTKETEFKNNTEYLEGIIKIPINNYGNDTLKRIFDSNTQIYRNIVHLMNKFENLQDSFSDIRQDTIQQYKNKIEELSLNIENLLRDRTSLQNEIKHSEIHVVANLKNKLKFTKIALDRQVDINTFEPQQLLLQIIRKFIVLNDIEENIDGNDLIKFISNNNELSSLFYEFCDNVSSKIQSIKEIKKELSSLNLYDEVGENK